MSGSLSTPAKVRLAITPSTALGYTVAHALGVAGSSKAIESAFGVVALALTAGLGAWLLYRVRFDRLVWSLGVLLLAAVLGGPAAWPWYGIWGLALLGCVRTAQTLAVAADRDRAHRLPDPCRRAARAAAGRPRRSCSPCTRRRSPRGSCTAPAAAGSRRVEPPVEPPVAAGPGVRPMSATTAERPLTPPAAPAVAAHRRASARSSLAISPRCSSRARSQRCSCSSSSPRGVCGSTRERRSRSPPSTGARCGTRSPTTAATCSATTCSSTS